MTLSISTETLKKIVIINWAPVTGSAILPTWETELGRLQFQASETPSQEDKTGCNDTCLSSQFRWEV
jgi:hypothetical protein